MSENIDYIYDEITEIENENETLKKDNEQLESKLNSNKQNIIEAQQKLEQIMKDLIDAGGFQKEETAELQMLYKIIEDSNNESNRIKMNKCLDLLINFSNQYLDIYKKSTEEEENNENTYEEKLNELLQLSRPELVDMCKDKDLSYSGSKKKLAERLLEN